MDRESAWQLVCEHVKDRGLQRHMLAVEAAMRWYAERLQQDNDYWGVVGLIHDFDWEIHPSLPEHPVQGAKILRRTALTKRSFAPCCRTTRRVLVWNGSSRSISRCWPAMR